MQAWLYKCTDDNRKINKTLLDGLHLDNIRLKENTSIIDPIFELSKSALENVTNYNYLWIPYFHRYYFVNNIIPSKGNLIELHCHVDVLYTNREKILAKKTLVERQENKYNPDIVDPLLKVKCGRDVKTKNIGNIGNDLSYVLTVTGG